MSSKFYVNQTVKCFWRNTEYQAKIVQVDKKKKLPYLVHYQGWNSRWNEWVHDNRLTLNDQPKQKAKTRLPKPDLRRIDDYVAVIYVSDDGDNLESLSEVREYCSEKGYLFVAEDFSFKVSPRKVKKERLAKAPKSSKVKTSKASNSKVKSRGIKNDLEEIKRSLDLSRNRQISEYSDKTKRAKKVNKKTESIKGSKVRPSANATVQLIMPPCEQQKNDGPMLNETREHSLARSFEALQDSLDRAAEHAFDDVLLNSTNNDNQTATEFIEIQAEETEMDVDIPRLSPAHAKSSLDPDPLNVESNLDESLGLACMVGGSVLSKINFSVSSRPNMISSRINDRLASLRGIKISAAPPEPSPGRVILKLAPLPVKANNASRNLQYLPYHGHGVQYMDDNYSPALHVGGRGRFGVVGEGAPPLPVVADHAEDFCRLPPQISSDHCYGKAAPPPGSVQFTNPNRIPPQFLPTAVVGTHKVPVKSRKHYAAQLHSLTQHASPSPLAYAQEDTLYVDDEFYEGYGGNVDLVGQSHHQQHNLGPSLSLLGHGQALMLDERLPANILEDIETEEQS